MSAVGDYNTIYYKGLVVFGLMGDFNTCYTENPGTVQNLGQSNLVVVCGAGSLVYNYDNAPSAGCGFVGIGKKDPAAFGSWPNPVSGELTVVTGASVAQLVRISDMDGREWLRSTEARDHRFTLDVSALASGSYICWLTFPDGSTQRHIFIKNRDPCWWRLDRLVPRAACDRAASDRSYHDHVRPGSDTGNIQRHSYRALNRLWPGQSYWIASACSGLLREMR